MTPLFTMGEIRREIEKALSNVDKAIIEMLKNRGEDFVTEARSQRTWKDRTTNLRSSIGFFIFYGDKMIEGNVEGTAEGQSEARSTVASIDKSDGTYYLFGIAGMEYAAAVESKGYNVITEQSITILPLIEGDMKKLEKMIKAA